VFTNLFIQADVNMAQLDTDFNIIHLDKEKELDKVILL